MRIRPFIVAAALIAVAPRLEAQHDPGAAPLAIAAPPQAAQYDFLVGEWELDVRPLTSGLAAKIHGSPKLKGTWKAWRALDGHGIEDELRIGDASGNPMALAESIRLFDPAAGHWQITLVDAYRSTIQGSTSEWTKGEMVVMASATGADGTTRIARTRFYDITPTSFRFQQDRSSDGGRTWTVGVLRIDAKRVAPSASR